MTRCSMGLVLALLCLPRAALAGPSTAPAPFALGRAPPPPASAARPTTPPVMVRFTQAPDAWTTRTVVGTRFTLELTSAGASRLTTLTARRVLLTREAMIRTRKGLTRTTTLRSVTASRNGVPEPRPAEAALVDRPFGVRLSTSGKVAGAVGLAAARDAVAVRSEADLLAENQATSAQLAGATPEDDVVKEAWEADSGRYLGKKLVPGGRLYFSERLRLPFLPRHSLSYFSEERVVGPVTVSGRPGVALEVSVFSMAMSEVASGISPTTRPDSPFADWARKSKARLSFSEARIRGGGRRVIALDGHGLLEQDMALDVTLTGALATEAGGTALPPARSVQLRLERQQRLLSGPPAPPRERAGISRPGRRNAPDRGGSRKAEPAAEE